MEGANILSGNYALVYPQPEAENGEIVVALLGEEVTLKRFYKRKGYIRLEAPNPRYPPLEIKSGQPGIQIIGKAVAIMRKLSPENKKA